MAQKRRAILALGALAAAAAHCAARESVGRRLITFGEAHTSTIDTGSDVVDEAEDIVVSTVLTGTNDSEDRMMRSPSTGISTIGAAEADDEVLGNYTTTDVDGERSFSDKDAEVDLKMTADGETGAEAMAKSEAPTAVPAPIRTSETPLTVSMPTLTAISVLTETPAEVPVSTDITMTGLSTTDTPVGTDSGQADTPMATTQSSYGLPDSLLIGVDTDTPASAGLTSTDVVVISPEEGTVMPLITAVDPAAETQSADPPSGTLSSGETDEPTTLPASFDSNGSNDAVTVSLASGSEGVGEETSLGQVHASSSADVSLNGSPEVANTKNADSSRFQGGFRKKAKMNKEASSSNGHYSADCSTGCSRGSLRDISSSDDGSNDLGGLLRPGGVSDANTSSATYYSLGTGSIFAIVGVIAGIMGLLVLFVAISRKKYTAEDDESPLPCGYNMEIHSVARLSPTFMEDDSFMESGYNGTAPMVAVPSHQYDGTSSTSGESSDEVPSLRGHMMAANHCEYSGDISARGRMPSTYNLNGDVDTGNVRMSALYSAGSSMTSSSEISGSWSSVLASDTEHHTLRNTRDTSFSAWSATNLSPFGSTTSGTSGMYGMTQSFSTAFDQTGGSDSSRSSPHITDHLPDEDRVAPRPVKSNCIVDSTEV